jgi:hypothetical protein
MITNQQRIIGITGLGLSAAVLGLVLWSPSDSLRLAAAIALVCFLPGWGLLEGATARLDLKFAATERLVLAAGLSYVITTVSGLSIYYMTGSFPVSLLLGCHLVFSLAGFGMAAVSPAAAGRSTWQRGKFTVMDGWLVGLLLLSAYFSFYQLAYSDLRGDEAEVMLRAVATIRGEGEPILSHTKGPAEVLLTAATGVYSDNFSELGARLPFAVAAWLAPLALYLLGTQLFSRPVGLAAMSFFVINGWLISHSRTAQYQTVILLLSILTIWSYYRFHRSTSQLFPLLGAAFLSTAMLAHYDGAAPIPVVVHLTLVTIKRITGSRGLHSLLHRSAYPAIGALLAGAVVVLSFYVPFLMFAAENNVSGHFSRNFGSEQPYNNWDPFYVNGLFYNSLYYVLGIGGLLLAGTLRGLFLTTKGGRKGFWLAIGAVPLLGLSWTGLLPAWYALLLYIGLVLLFLISPNIPLTLKTMIYWLVAPLGLYLFLVIRPGNHFYVVIPPLLLLAAVTLAWLNQQLARAAGPRRQWAFITATVIVGGWFGLSAWYVDLIFMRTDLEHMLTYPQHRNPLFVSDSRYPFDIRIGWGFPYRLGWQTVSDLYRQGVLTGDWYGNDHNNSIFWYTLGQPRNPCYPEYFMLTEIGYKSPPLEVAQNTIDRYYRHSATVQVNGHERLQLFQLDPLHVANDHEPTLFKEPGKQQTIYHLDTLQGRRLDEDAYTATPVVSLDPASLFKPHPQTLAQIAETYGDPRISQVKDMAELKGYDLDTRWATAGGVLLLTLHWQAAEVINIPYKVFVHLVDKDGTIIAQSDDLPNCSANPTNRWSLTRPVTDRHLLPLPDDLLPGQYQLLVGLYEPKSGLRLDYLDQMGNPQGVSLPLTSIDLPAAN